MATDYVVLREVDTVPSGQNGANPVYHVVHNGVLAANAEQARRLVAEDLEDQAALDAGVTLIAVPARNWKSGRGTLKAETTRRIRAST
jgi:hypothetical protein